MPGRPVLEGKGELVGAETKFSSCSSVSLSLLAIRASWTSVSSSSRIVLSLIGAVLGLSLPVSVRTWNAGDVVGLDPRRNVGEMGLVARDLLGLSRGRGEPPVLKGRNKAWGWKTSLVGEEDTGKDVASLPGGGALGRLAWRKLRVPKFLRWHSLLLTYKWDSVLVERKDNIQTNKAAIRFSKWLNRHHRNVPPSHVREVWMSRASFYMWYRLDKANRWFVNIETL